jgi:hypothetical protein
MDRGSQANDVPLFVAWPPPAEIAVEPAKPQRVLRLDELKPDSGVRSDDAEDVGVKEAYRTSHRLFQSWCASKDQQWFKVQVPLTSDNPRVLDMSLLVGLYAPWAGPSDKERSFRLVERRIDLATVALGDVAASSMPRADCVYQQGRWSKLGVGVDLTRSTLQEWSHHGERMLSSQTLATLLRKAPSSDVEAYKTRMKRAREWAFRLCKLANLQSYMIHPTRRMLHAEQSLRKFNVSYYMSPSGEPHPGERWMHLQYENLSVLDAPTCLAWLRMVLLAERVDYMPHACKTPLHALNTTKRLMAAMAALPARCAYYLADCVDRCTPVLDKGTVETTKETPAASRALLAPASSQASRSSLSASPSAPSGFSLVTHRPRGSLVFVGRLSEPSAPPSPASSTDSWTIVETTTLAKEPLAQTVIPKAVFSAELVSPQLITQTLASASRRRRVQRKLHLNACGGRSRGHLRLRRMPNGLCKPTSSECKMLHGHASSGALGAPSSSLAPLAKVTWRPEVGGYRVLGATEAQTLFNAVGPVSRRSHTVEMTDEYDGILDCMHPATTCNDCETQGYTCCRCYKSLRVFLETASPKDTEALDATELERAWWGELIKLVHNHDLHAITLLCSTMSSATENTGKRSGEGDGPAVSLETRPPKDVCKRNEKVERRLEGGASLVTMEQLEEEADGSTWTWWPDLDQTPYDTLAPPLVKHYRSTYLSPVQATEGKHRRRPKYCLSRSGTSNASFGVAMASGDCRIYDGERTDDSPDLGCHVIAAQMEWPDLHAKALCGIIVEQLVQRTGRSPNDQEKKDMYKTFAAVAQRLQLTKTNDDTVDQDPALMLMECTEYSHAQQMGTERNGLGKPWDDPAEREFYRHFRETFGDRSGLFMHRLPIQSTRQYDMYHSVMEISSHALAQLYGCGNWTWYDVETDRHGVDFRQLFNQTRHDWLTSESGRNIVLRPTTPLMSTERWAALGDVLWPLERQTPLAPQLASVVQPNTPASTVKVYAAKERQREFCLFVSVAHWETVDPTDRTSLKSAFEAWAAAHRHRFRLEELQIHGYLRMVVLHVE